MSAQRGRDLLVKIGDGGSPETFTTVAGLRATTLSFNAQTVDVTNADSANQWRELLAGAGVKAAALFRFRRVQGCRERREFAQRVFQSGHAELPGGDPELRHRRRARSRSPRCNTKGRTTAK